MSNQKIKVAFGFRISQSPKKAALGKGILTYTLTQGGKKLCEKSTKLECRQFEFDPEMQKFLGENGRELNMELLRIKQKIADDVCKYLVDGDYRPLFKGMQYDTIEFKNELKPLMEVVDEYVNFQEGKIRKKSEKKHVGNIEFHTWRTYKFRRDNSLIPFLRKSSPKIIKLKDVNLMFLENYFTFLTTTKTIKGQTRSIAYSNKCIKFLKTVMRFAATNGYIYDNITMQHRNKRETPKPVRVLSPQDLEKLENCEIYTPSEARVVDVFLFSKETFLHIGDYLDLRSEHLKTDKDGDKWIVKDRVKAQEEGRQVQRVPLTEKAINLLEKYGSIEDMPHYANSGSFNYFLKMAAEKAGIESEITFKMARSSGISEAYNEKSLRGESIAVCAGWTTTKELRSYLAIDYGQLKNEFTKPIKTAENGSMYQI